MWCHKIFTVCSTSLQLSTLHPHCVYSLCLVYIDSERVSLKVSFLPKHIGDTELKKAVLAIVQDDVAITVIPVLQQETNYGYINCPNAACADEIETNLDGLKIDGQRLMVRRQNKQKGYVHQKVTSQAARSDDQSGSRKAQSVKMSQFPPRFSEQDFMQLKRKFLGTVKSSSFHQTHGFLVFYSHKDAQSACERLLELGYKARLT